MNNSIPGEVFTDTGWKTVMKSKRWLTSKNKNEQAISKTINLGVTNVNKPSNFIPDSDSSMNKFNLLDESQTKPEFLDEIEEIMDTDQGTNLSLTEKTLSRPTESVLRPTKFNCYCDLNYPAPYIVHIESTP